MQNTFYNIQNTVSEIQNKKHNIQITNYKIQYTKYKVQNTKFQKRNTTYKIHELITFWYLCVIKVKLTHIKQSNVVHCATSWLTSNNPTSS